MHSSIQEVVRGYLSKNISRRKFMRNTVALGLSNAAASSLLAAIDSGTELDPTEESPSIALQFKGSAGAALVAQLRALGVQYVFHTNTSRVEQFMDAVLENEMQVIMVTHEGQAVSAAQGYAMASGKLGYFIGSQVGVGNLISNLYNAWKDRTPLLVTFGRTKLEQQGGQDSFEEWDDHLKPAEPFSAWSWSCVDAQTIPEIVRRAVKFAYAPPGAPATLDFPNDLLNREIECPILSLDPLDLRPVYRADSQTVEQAARMLVGAQSPVFVVGPEISRGHAGQAMVDLAEKAGVPVFQADDLFCDFPTRHPLYLGSYLGSKIRFPEGVDLVFAIGAKIGSVPKGARIVHVSSDANLIGRRNDADLPIVADVATLIADLSVALDPHLRTDRVRQARDRRRTYTSTLTTELRAARELALRDRFDDSPIIWQRVGWELEQLLDDDAVIVPEIGSQSNKILGELSQGIGAKTRIGRTTGSALGWGIGAAFGVQLALPHRQVVALQGDGGLLFGQTETLWTISRYQAPILIVVMNNHSYNETRNRNMADGGTQYHSGRDLTSYLGDPDVQFTKIAEAYGIRAERVSEPENLRPAMIRALRETRDGKPFLLDIEVERDGIMSDSTWHQEFSISALAKVRS